MASAGIVGFLTADVKISKLEQRRTEMYRIEKNYRNNAALRKSFNELAQKTFGLNFEDWYQNGFWGDSYTPYSVVANGKVIANVSVNKTDLLVDGEVKHFLQLGTVMTEEKYRNKGFSRMFMEQIQMDYAGKTDGIYLFANDSVLDFYPKFGFRKSKEYLYSRKVFNQGENQLEQIVMDSPVVWKRLQKAMEKNTFHGKCDMVNNDGLIMFYVSGFMQESVFYHRDTDTYIIADVEEGTVFIHNVFSSTIRELEKVTALFGKDVDEVTLGFAPADAEGYEMVELHEEDSTFFIAGDGMKVIEEAKLRIPSLAHA